MNRKLAKVESLMVIAERRANELRDLLSRGASQNVDEVAQLSDALDTILQLKLSKDILKRFVAFGAAEPKNEKVH